VKNILVATDGSPSAERALDMAARFAADSQAQLTILTVVQMAIDEDLKKFGRIEHASTRDLLEEEASAILIRAKERATETGVAQIKTLVKRGDPAEVILEVTKQLPVDSIVVGKRGRGRLEGLLLGSVSQKLVNLAPCPVMVVP
jgi:nucleotide-binding universal stress UspA family protein